ncbi:GNAT family N-acetyltransferase [Anaerofilum sp. BX8]|uniref:GNAT family N-acetyltransferase n=1 Tax=Anaerofilum hominis TaxID=2763016 RepID=A0A923L0R7_9FIRM|nr:GNAT family N-acetyltransferase [Anaerofilum hominis]MBC5580970.1 GNAT family N-acetyltransferase [Anaerofilum hominis]
MKLKCAAEKDFTNIRNFYYSLIEIMEKTEFDPGWEKDIYPTQEFLITSIQNRDLYFIENDTQIQACMIVNHLYNKGYKEVKWSVDAEDPELLVIHALGVHPDHAGKGLAKEMVRNVIEMAREQKLKTIRLDVLEGNVPAEKAYSKMGFQYVTTLKLFYEDTGWTNFRVYEYII